MHTLVIIAALLAVAVALPISPAARHQAKKHADNSDPEFGVRGLFKAPEEKRDSGAEGARDIIRRYIGVVLGGGGYGGGSSSGGSDFGSQGWSSSSDDDYYDDYYGDDDDDDDDDYYYYDDDDDDDDDDDYRAVVAKRNNQDNEKVMIARQLARLSTNNKKHIGRSSNAKGKRDNKKIIRAIKAIRDNKFLRDAHAMMDNRRVRQEKVTRQNKAVRGTKAIRSPHSIPAAKAMRTAVAEDKVERAPSAHAKRDYRQSQWSWVNDKFKRFLSA